MIKVTKENIDDLIDMWHEGDSELELYEYLGFTEQQYAHWIQTNELPND